MRFDARVFFVAVVAALAVAGLSAPFAQGASGFGVEKFVAANCAQTHEKCAEESITTFPTEPSLSEAYTQAAGHPPWGVTTFKVNTEGPGFPNEAPSGILTAGPVTHVRTDVAPGVSTNPEAVAKCSFEEFGQEALPGSGLFPAAKCSAESEIGENKVVVWLGPEPSPAGGDLPLHGKVYNLVQPQGLASDFGVALQLPIPLTEAKLKAIFHGTQPAIEKAQYYSHTLIEGSIEWAGDYHDYYEINVSPELPLISSRLVLKGNILLPGKENGGFITNPTRCSGPGPFTTNTVALQSQASQSAARTYTDPIGPEGCLGEAGFTAPPFEPSFKLLPATNQSDAPDGLSTEVIVPHDPSPSGIDSSQLRTATVTLPEGMTLNPAAAQGMEACTPAQIGIKTRNPVACPANSKIGTVTLTVPDLPATEPLTGNVYLGGGPTITGPPFKLYLDAESARYGISTRLEGTVVPNEVTGRVTTTFDNNPEQPFSDAKLSFTGGALAPIANPLVCGPAKTETSLVPYTGTPTQSPFSSFSVDSNNAGGVCPSPLPFSLSQSTEDHPTGGAENTNFTVNLSRGDGNQYVSKVSTTLPEGLVGKIPVVPLCPEPQASAGTCSSTSQIGTATAAVGAGPTPAHFSGPVYLTGPFGGAPYGMTVVINAAVGPFSLGNVVTRAGLEVNRFTARVTVASQLPTIVKGVPLRLKALSVAINRQGFLVNPTNCGALTTSTALTSTFGGVDSISSPFQATGCSSLAFKPKFTASTSAKTSRKNGASLFVKVGYPTGLQANIKSVVVTVPKQLPSRLSTLKNACLEAVFNANPFNCPKDTRIGGATAVTPVVPGKMTGPIYFVSHGGAAFPDLDMILTGNGITIVLVGNTNISKGITTTTFAAVPDVPVSSFEMKLPVGSNSALAGNGKTFCTKPLLMPTTITGQNGKVIKQNTKLSISNCPVRIVSHNVSGHTVVLKVQTYEAGRVSGSGSNLKTVYRHLKKASSKATLKVPLSNGGLKTLATHKPLFVRVRVGFLPKSKGKPTSTAFVTVKVG